MESFIFSIIEKEKLDEMLTAFQALTELTVQVIDEKGNIVISKGEITPFCREFRKHLKPEDSCAKVHTEAAKKAISVGETYIFSCHAGLNHIVFPLMNKNTFLGSVLAGPFLMMLPDSTLMDEISHRYNLGTSDLLNLYDLSGSVPVISPSKVTQISKLLFYLLVNLISDCREQFITNQGKLLQQSKISESIQNYKLDGAVPEKKYPYEKEKQLISMVKLGDQASARSILNDLLGYVLFEEGNAIENIKSRSVELCSLLSRAAIEGGAPTDRILILNNEYLKKLSELKDIDSICYKLQEVVEVFTDSMFSRKDNANSDAVKRAVTYMSRHYAENITLEQVSEIVHLNPSYFSTLFRQVTGSTFKDHLNMIRIEESKHLLANTDYSIINIAISCGFGDQSYFSKVFRKYTGLTPKQYR